MELAESIRTIRKEMRMSQREFANELNCAQSLISSYENGIKKPSYDVLVALGNIAKKHKVKVKLL